MHSFLLRGWKLALILSQQISSPVCSLDIEEGYGKDRTKRFITRDAQTIAERKKQR
jgi:hypothetical protein